MVKKLATFSLIFFILIGFNFYLIFKMNLFYKKELQIKKILSEIPQKFELEKQFNFSAAPMVLGSYKTEFKLSDSRVSNLQNFFRKYNSPLYDFAEKIVAVSDKYGFDYRLLPAIAMQESNLCRHIPSDSYNCWGWGVFGNHVIRFSSFDEAIETVARGLKEQYLDKGLITASAIMKKYTPSSDGSWANSVNTFLRILE